MHQKTLRRNVKRQISPLSHSLLILLIITRFFSLYRTAMLLINNRIIIPQQVPVSGANQVVIIRPYVALDANNYH